MSASGPIRQLERRKADPELVLKHGLGAPTRYGVPDPMDAIAGMPERQPLPAGAVAVLAPRPAAGPALAILQLLLGPANAAVSGRLLLGILDPADELVARQGCDVLPNIECRGVGGQRLAQVCG